MRIAVTGSIATDHLMVFPGRIADLLIADRLHEVSLSLLVDSLDMRRGGVAANIAFGLGRLGLRPLLVGSVGEDFGPYRSWLEQHGVDTAHVRVSRSLHTARFVCTTDADQNQIATFYTGAMAEARRIGLAPIERSVGGLDLVLIGANDPEAMLRHTDECRERGLVFAADPSQQLARMEGAEIRRLVDGAAYLFSNAYEMALIEQKTGWSRAEILDRVGVRVTTLGADGVRIDGRGIDTFEVGCVEEDSKVDPTGVGDAFRAGFLAGVAWGHGPERSAQLGCALAALVVETVGTQEYDLKRSRFVERFARAYGPDAATEIEPRLAALVADDGEDTRADTRDGHATYQAARR
jgi:adenosine kinase